MEFKASDRTDYMENNRSQEDISSKKMPHGYVNTLVIFVNGKKVEVKDPDPEMILVDFLRKKLRLTGSKVGCNQGGCGACTVMLSRYNPDSDVIDHFAVNACITPLCSLHGLAVTTIEGIGSVRGQLHPVQRKIAESHGSQCGFCTPGIVMSMYTLLRNNPHPTQKEIQATLDGNLCRCTGYRPILEGFSAFAKKSCQMGESCCQVNGKHCDREINTDFEINGSENTPQLYDPSQEPIFPPELKLNSALFHQDSLKFETDRVIWLSPSSLEELLAIRRAHPESQLVSGSTKIGLEIKFKKIVYPVLVSVSRVPELQHVQYTEHGIQIGASLPLYKVDAVLKSAVKQLPEHKTRVFTAFIEMFKWFGGQQIRSVVSLAGNIMAASPTSDLNPLLLACKASLEVTDRDGHRKCMTMDENFFTGYRQTCLNKTDTLLSVTIPYTRKNEHFLGFKQANRKEDDTAIVNAGMRVDLGDNGTHVQDISLAFGGVSMTTVLATKTMTTLIGRSWDDTLLETACSMDMLPADLPLPPGSPGGMIAYRRTLALSFFYRFFTAITKKLQLHSVLADFSAADDIQLNFSSGIQSYQMPSDVQPSNDLLGRPVVHLPAYKQATGEAVYVDDVPASKGELFAGLVLSTSAHAKILNVDPSTALSMPGVVDFITAKDVPGSNSWNDTEDLVFACDEVVHEGQIIGMVLADSLEAARRAADQVRVEYQDLEPVITIQDAINKNSYFNFPRQVIQCGDIDKGLSLADLVLEGEFHLDAQEHFYLEPHACIVYPRDTDEYHVLCMTHSMDMVQVALSKVLAIPESRINLTVKRIGGSFGGKQERHGCIVHPAAVGAYKTRRPVRVVLNRDEDIKLTGTRHPILAKYKVAAKCLLMIGNTYKIPNMHVASVLCQTNITSCVAFRGFGTPQGMAIMEYVLEHVANVLGRPSEKVRENHFYRQGDQTAYGQVIEQSNLLLCWEECLKQSDYYTRVQMVQEFNRSTQWKKRGISITPLTYGIGYPVKFLNQGTAIVNIYKDGSVLLLAAGIEMGQGLHTKMVQIVTGTLNVPQTYVHIADCSTQYAQNSAPTAGSLSTDLTGMALVKACEELKARLAPYRSDENKEWKQVVQSALLDRECLSAVGFYKSDAEGMDWTKSVNSPFTYYSFGAACTEVEIDCLTGDHQVLKTDIVMDAGQSLNPAIDVGQIEGAFVQGYGMLALEQYKVASDGKHITSGPGNYKIPAVSNIPQVFNVTLLKNTRNLKAVYSSKGIGEPPFCLAMSAFLAIKSAISAARLDNGHQGYFQLHPPATPDKIRMACLDQFAQKFLTDDVLDKEKPWFVPL